MVDAGRVRALLDRLSEETKHLQRLSGYPEAELLADPDRLAAIKYRFMVAIETCIDLSQHIIASEGLRAATDYADAFEVMAEASFIQQDRVGVLKEMARFRNLLVHSYQRVDDSRVIHILGTRLPDLESFGQSIASRIS